MNIYVLLFLPTLDVVCARRVEESLNEYGDINISNNGNTNMTCEEYCQTAGFSQGTVFGISPWCLGSCSTCRGKCLTASWRWNSGSVCWSGKKTCCCEEPKSNCADFCRSRGYGWGVLEGTDPYCTADCEKNCNAKAGYCKEASPKLFTDHGSNCASGNKICCCKPNPLLNGTLPDGTQVMPLRSNKEFTIYEKKKWNNKLNKSQLALDTDSNEYVWTMRTPTGEEPILIAKGKHHSHTFGHQSVHVMDQNGTELFKIRRSNSKFNPFQWHWSFRILPPGSKSNNDALFTINSGVEKGFRGARWLRGMNGSVTKFEAWRIYRGCERDDEMIYFCVGSLVGWSFRCYPNQKSYKTSGPTGIRNTVAHVTQHIKLGGILSGYSASDTFSLSVREGEDPLVLLSWVAIVSMTRKPVRKTLNVNWVESKHDEEAEDESWMQLAQ